MNTSPNPVSTPSALSVPALGTENCLNPPTEAAPDYADWFGNEVHPHEQRLRYYLRGKFPTVSVDDVVQESFLRIWKRRLLGPVMSPQSYLYRIAQNLAFDAVRRQARSPIKEPLDNATSDVLDSRPDAADFASTREEFVLLMAAIESLPPRCREVVILRKFHGLSARQIALKLGLSEGTVHNYGGQGVTLCLQFLRAHGIENRKR